MGQLVSKVLEPAQTAKPAVTFAEEEAKVCCRP
jgi:hypothetical protein